MSYYSYHTISLAKIKEDKKLDYINSETDFALNIIKDFRDNNKNAYYGIDEKGFSQQDCSWYSVDEELKEFSLKYPDIVFLLEREGEQNDDLEQSYFYRGKKQENYAVITFDDFDANFFGI